MGYGVGVGRPPATPADSTSPTVPPKSELRAGNVIDNDYLQLSALMMFFGTTEL